MADEKTFTKEFRESLENKRIGSNFLGILNDIKRRPSDAAKELEISNEEIQNIINGDTRLSSEIVSKAIKIWPVNARDFYTMHDDCPDGLKIMSCEDSVKSSRIMHRSGKPYYEYRDTAMSSVGPFRPEWIEQLCIVDNDEPNNKQVQWNNGHFMHQFTYFIGDVNFYYIDENGEKKVAVMNTGDSNYITPFIPHSFATRKGASKNGLILALTYGNQLAADTQQELSAVGEELSLPYWLDFSSRKNAFALLLNFHRNCASLSFDELEKRTSISKEKLIQYENSSEIPSYETIVSLAAAMNVNARDLLPNDVIEDKVIVQYYKDSAKWDFPETTKAYEIVELAHSRNLPFSKAFEFTTLKENDSNSLEELDLIVGLHQYIYNVGESTIRLNWKINNKSNLEELKPGDSVYIKPNVLHNFRNKGKLMVLRIAGRIAGDAQRELSSLDKNDAHRAISEVSMWFDPHEKINIE